MNVLIVDDEKPARDRLRRILADEAAWNVVGEAANGLEALRLAEELAPDIVLLDIRMPGMAGIEAAHHLNAMQRPPAIVFTTAYDEYAIEAFEARAIGYVLKPVRRTRLVRALGQAVRLAPKTVDDTAASLDAQRKNVCARSQGRLKLIAVDEIASFHADHKYVAVRHDGGRDLISDSLKSLESEFGDRFVRIHRGALVAVDRIRQIDTDAAGQSRAVLRDDSQVGDEDLIISRRHVAEVKRRLRKS